MQMVLILKPKIASTNHKGKKKNLSIHKIARRTRANLARLIKACRDIGILLPIRTILNKIRRYYDIKHDTKA